MNKSGIGILRDENGKQVTDDQSKADLLGKFFSSVFTNDNHVTPQIDKLVDPDSSGYCLVLDLGQSGASI